MKNTDCKHWHQLGGDEGYTCKEDKSWHGGTLLTGGWPCDVSQGGLTLNLTG